MGVSSLRTWLWGQREPQTPSFSTLTDQHFSTFIFFAVLYQCRIPRGRCHCPSLSKGSDLLPSPRRVTYYPSCEAAILTWDGDGVGARIFHLFTGGVLLLPHIKAESALEGGRFLALHINRSFMFGTGEELEHRQVLCLLWTEYLCPHPQFIC